MTGETWGASLWRTIVAWFACLLATLVLFSVLDGKEWFVRALGVMTLVAALGALGRAARVPRPLIVVVQVLAGWCYVTALYAGEYARGGFIPDRDAIDALQRLTDEGFAQIETLTPPVVPGAGVSLVTVVAVLIAAIQIDLLAVSYRQTAVAGLPLLALYVVPAAILPDGVDAWLFTLPAFGFLLLLVTDSRDRLLGWGIPVGGRLAEGARSRGAGQLSRMSRNVGLTVLSLSVAIPAAVPRFTDGAFGDKGIGDTQGRTISTLDPLVTMRRDLLNRTDVPLMRVRTDSARPSEMYLRAVTLDEFNGVEWKAARREVRKFDDGSLPDAPGLTPTVETSPVETQVTAGENMQSDYLPIPYPASRLTIDGAWRLDELTGNVVSYEGRDQISGKHVLGEQPRRDPRQGRRRRQAGAAQPLPAAVPAAAGDPRVGRRHRQARDPGAPRARWRSGSRCSSGSVGRATSSTTCAPRAAPATPRWSTSCAIGAGTASTSPPRWQ